MIKLNLGLNEARKLARDINTIIELTEGRFISLSILRNVLFQELETFANPENKRYRVSCFLGDNHLYETDKDIMSLEEAISDYIHLRDLQPENIYTIEVVE